MRFPVQFLVRVANVWNLQTLDLSGNKFSDEPSYTLGDHKNLNLFNNDINQEVILLRTISKQICKSRVDQMFRTRASFAHLTGHKKSFGLCFTSCQKLPLMLGVNATPQNPKKRTAQRF
ncbi:hypothetical protein CTI12_AA026830 [Artemisia annua]|uniref:Uncharacterized protein n=1 Tax=Artemisia annua TaxID=35608 RepID=A0A2U1QI68_ARTAN|nr:hypothetical protein CTI12_AA026830 [Artemisia annua]